MAIKFNFNINGVQGLNGNLNYLKTMVPTATHERLLDEVNAIMAESLTEVPRDTNSLADSAFVEDNAGNITFGYGGNNVKTNPKNGESTEDYMLIVHEDLSVNHPVGKAKFLEDPINRHKVNFESNLIQKIRSIFSFLR